MHPIINRNSIKISYSCLPNVKQIISKHNSKILRGGESTLPPCVCDIGQCPVEGKCQTHGVIYKATLTHQGNKTETYVGLTARPFIVRHKEHQRNFHNREKRNSTTLSRKIWCLRDQNIKYELNWEILQKSKPYQPGNSCCHMCLADIYFILFQKLP